MTSRIYFRRNAGFTLIEAVIVIVITGVLAGIVAVFIAKPVQGYVDSVRRAELTDAADVALRRITRDVRLALPNSLRVTAVGSVNYIEFIMTTAGGRYRSDGDGSTAGGNILSFTDTTVTTFDVLSTMPSNPAIAANDYIVIYNLGEGYAPGNAYVATDPCVACNRAKVTTVAGNNITLATNPFAAESPPLPSPNSRFQVVPGSVRAVTFACPMATPGNLMRYWNYGFTTSQPTSFSSGSSALLAANAICIIDYTSAATGRNGLLYIKLTLNDTSSATGTESVTMFQQIHVDNAP